MSMDPARRNATYQDVLDAPEHMIAELIDGELFLQPRPAKPHTQTASSLGAQLHVAFQLGQGGPGGWWILDEPEVHFGAQVLVPDLGGWRKSEVPTFDRSLAYYAERPDWVAEVLSPSTEGHDRLKKLRVYHSAGIPWVWLVHPERRSVEVYAHRDEGYVLLEAFDGAESLGTAVKAAPFEALALQLDTLWL